MKKIFYILIPFILVGYFPLSDSPSQTNLKTEINSENKLQKNNAPAPIENVKLALKCKSCHISEYPTKKAPGLRDCPRNNVISVYHSPKEGPDVVEINEMCDKYTGVVFSHRIHAEMSEMSTGCTGCHHFNTTGRVLNCRNCHENSRKREDISVPDLKAAFHRQCLTCHKQWSNENGCNNHCHFSKSSNQEQSIEKVMGKSHPKLIEPTKIIWETNSKVNKTVTFYHDEHINLFRVNCTSCHTQESCIKCHSQKIPDDYSKPIRIEKTPGEHHKPCSNCHYGNSCQKCHDDKETSPFNHAKNTGWSLNPYHSKLECVNCHGNNMPYRKLNNSCTSCHENFTTAFDHKLKGFVFSETHNELECENCHLKKDFAKKPVCTDCHDDKSYPEEVPGKRVKK